MMTHPFARLDSNKPDIGILLSHKRLAIKLYESSPLEELPWGSPRTGF